MIGYWALTNEKPFAEVEKGNMVRYKLERGERPSFDPALKLPAPLVDAISLCWRFQNKVFLVMNNYFSFQKTIKECLFAYLLFFF